MELGFGAIGIPHRQQRMLASLGVANSAIAREVGEVDGELPGGM